MAPRAFPEEKESVPLSALTAKIYAVRVTRKVE